jgi:hypothetical protein
VAPEDPAVQFADRPRLPAALPVDPPAGLTPARAYLWRATVARLLYLVETDLVGPPDPAGPPTGPIRKGQRTDMSTGTTKYFIVLTGFPAPTGPNSGDVDRLRVFATVGGTARPPLDVPFAPPFDRSEVMVDDIDNDVDIDITYKYVDAAGNESKNAAPAFAGHFTDTIPPDDPSGGTVTVQGLGQYAPGDPHGPGTDNPGGPPAAGPTPTPAP